VTGEYPPQAGGVADYTALLARGLAEAGDCVTVFAPLHPATSGPLTPGVMVERLPDHFGPRGLMALGRALLRIPRPDRLLIQYVPQAYGYRGMNLPLSLWLRHASPIRPWVMFHEIASPVLAGQPLRHRMLALVQWRMAALVAHAAEQAFVSTPAWWPLLAKLAPRLAPVWLPVPSNLPSAADTDAVAVVRRKLDASGDSLVVGHFGSFGQIVTGPLEQVLPALLAADRRRVGLLIGMGGEAFTERLLGRHPELRGQIRATGFLPPDATTAHLAACDLLIQPYPDGVTARRGSAMAALALGRPLVTTDGELSEPLWRQSAAVGLAAAGSPAALLDAAEAILNDARRREELGERGRAFYRDHFSPQRLIATLRREAGLAADA
jgi:glycosyltransferase involved in cell wall biosynthesis